MWSCACPTPWRHTGRNGIAVLILYLDNKLKCSASSPGSFTSRQKPRYALNIVGGPQNLSGPITPSGIPSCNSRPTLRFPAIHTSRSKQQSPIIQKAGSCSKYKSYIDSIWNSPSFHHAKKFYFTEKSIQYSFAIPWLKGNQCHKAWPHPDFTLLVTHSQRSSVVHWTDKFSNACGSLSPHSQVLRVS
jgi:hypothetical protein